MKKASDKKTNSEEVVSEDTPRDGKKNRPTPKRKEAQKKNLRPLVADSKKERRARSRKERQVALQRQRDALDGRGDQRYLPLRDRGPVRKYARDFLDARWTVSEFLLPLMLLAMIPAFIFDQNSLYAYIPVVSIYVLLVIGLIEIFIITKLIRRNLSERYSKEEMRGLGMYVMGRILSPRRFRSPVPAVKRGDTVKIP